MAFWNSPDEVCLKKVYWYQSFKERQICDLHQEASKYMIFKKNNSFTGGTSGNLGLCRIVLSS